MSNIGKTKLCWQYKYWNEVESHTWQKRERKEEWMNECVSKGFQTWLRFILLSRFLECVCVVGWAMTPLLSSLSVVVQMFWPWLHPTQLSVHWTVRVQLYHSLCPLFWLFSISPLGTIQFLQHTHSCSLHRGSRRSPLFSSPLVLWSSPSSGIASGCVPTWRSPWHPGGSRCTQPLCTLLWHRREIGVSSDDS